MQGRYDGSGAVDGALGAARRSADDAAPWVKLAARVGYAAKGLVYVVVGILAGRAALGQNSGPGDTRDALGTLLQQPLGRVLLGVVAGGLFGYALWRLLSAALDTEGKGTDGKGIAVRLGFAGSGILHALLGLEAARLALGRIGGGGGGGGGDNQAEHWTARVLEMPAGQWLVGLGALGIAAFGVYQLYRAASGDKVAKHLDLHELDAGSRRWAVRAGRIGVAARGVVFGVIAWLLLQAALASRASEAGGLQEALSVLGQRGTGQLILGAIALGFIAYGLFQFVVARYRRFAM